MKLLCVWLTTVVLDAAQGSTVPIRVTVIDKLATSRDAALVEDALKRDHDASFKKPLDIVVSRALDADQRHWTSLFKIKMGSLEGVSIAEYQGQDTLMAKWLGPSGEPAVRSILLWDMPRFNLTILHCDPAVLGSPASIQSFLDRLLKVEGSPIGVASVDFRLVTRPAATGFLGAGWVTFTHAPERALPGYEFDLSAFLFGTDAYFVFRTGKKLVEGVYPPELVFVSMRFPPLRARIQQLSKEEISRRLGKSPEEDSILIQGLLERQLSDGEFTALLGGNGLPPMEQIERISLVIRSATEIGQIDKYQKAVRESLKWFESLGSQGAPLAGALIRVLRGVQTLDFSDAAMTLLRTTTASKDALSYLEFRGNTREVLDFLTGLRLSGQLEEQRERTVHAVSLRVRPPEANK